LSLIPILEVLFTRILLRILSLLTYREFTNDNGMGTNADKHPFDRLKRPQCRLSLMPLVYKKPNLKKYNFLRLKSALLSVGCPDKEFTLYHLFLSVIPTPLRTMVSRLGFVVIASIYLGSAILGLMLCARTRPPGRTRGKSLLR
jgi:hypothetical protein